MLIASNFSPAMSFRLPTNGFANFAVAVSRRLTTKSQHRSSFPVSSIFPIWGKNSTRPESCRKFVKSCIF